jgi:hypothetical protein
MDCRVKPGNDEVFVGQLITVMAGLDPAIHSAARTVNIRVFWYYGHAGREPVIHDAVRRSGSMAAGITPRGCDPGTG